MESLRKRILFVEDQPDTCELVRLLLSGADVECVPDGRSGLHKARSDHFSMIVLDYYLPDLDGAAVCCQIRSFDCTTPIVFFTSSPHIGERDLKRLGAQGLVSKGDFDFASRLSAMVEHFAVQAG